MSSSKNPASVSAASLQKSKSMLQQELLRFAEELEIANFRAVSSGIGLGTMKRVAQAEPVRWHDPVVEMPPAAAAAHTRSQAENAPSAVPQSAENAQFSPEFIATATIKPLQAKRPSMFVRAIGSAARLIGIFVVDSVVVALSLVVAMAVASAALGIRADGAQAGIAGLTILAPIKWLAGFSIVQVLAGFYGVFIVYALTLRIVAGGTLGQAIFRSSPAPAGIPEQRRL